MSGRSTLAGPIRKVDVVGIPSTDGERSRAFYVDTLGLRPDENARYEFWAGDTCFAIWYPEQFGVEYQPQANSIVLLQVDDVATARAELEAKGVQFEGETFDTGVCHMANFSDPDGNPLTLHKRYAPYAERSA
jgi:catechol 2,3-dioxygenase-like lactoylglutathione lyase family enzyme